MAQFVGFHEILIVEPELIWTGDEMFAVIRSPTVRVSFEDFVEWERIKYAHVD